MRLYFILVFTMQGWHYARTKTGLSWNLEGLFPPSGSECESDKDQRIKDKHQKKSSLSFGVNGP